MRLSTQQEELVEDLLQQTVNNVHGVEFSSDNEEFYSSSSSSSSPKLFQNNYNNNDWYLKYRRQAQRAFEEYAVNVQQEKIKKRIGDEVYEKFFSRSGDKSIFFAPSVSLDNSDDDDDDENKTCNKEVIHLQSLCIFHANFTVRCSEIFSAENNFKHLLQCCSLCNQSVLPSPGDKEEVLLQGCLVLYNFKVNNGRGLKLDYKKEDWEEVDGEEEWVEKSLFIPGILCSQMCHTLDLKLSYICFTTSQLMSVCDSFNTHIKEWDIYDEEFTTTKVIATLYNGGKEMFKGVRRKLCKMVKNALYCNKCGHSIGSKNNRIVCRKCKIYVTCNKRSCRLTHLSQHCDSAEQTLVHEEMFSFMENRAHKLIIPQVFFK